MAATPAVDASELQDDERSILEILAVLFRRWRVVIGFPLVVALVVVGISFLVPPKYTATTSFVPETRSEGGVPASLGALAGQLGISFGSEASESPRFYAEVAKSRGILNRLLLSRYANPQNSAKGEDSTTLLMIFRSGGRNGVDSLERGAKKLTGLIAVGVDAQTNIVTVKVQSEYPDLAASVANRLVAYLNDFNTQNRQSQARERRKFTEQRVTAGESELRDSEEALKRFYQANRSWQQSPQLTFEEGQLRRQVDLRQDVYRTVRREYETARIQEVNDTPVITVIDLAVVPQRKSGPTRRLWALAAFVLSGVFAVSWAFGAEYLGRARREQDGPYRDLMTSAQEVWGVVWPFGAKAKKAQRDS
jgi:uncharacterized protein involved in exopolysaccharide biosynthesis